MDEQPRQQRAAEASIDGPFALVLTGDDAALAALDVDERIVDELLALAADPVLGAALASSSRPQLTDGAHPARLLLHAVARQYRLDGTPLDLGADYLEALAALLVEGRAPWTSAAAMEWSRWTLHQSEAAGGWRLAGHLLRKHPATTLPPRVATAFAMLAERAGAPDAAAELWGLARSHPDLVADARTRWMVEFDWARDHLMLSGGSPSRAAFVLQRVQAAMLDRADEPGRMLLLNATIECSFANILSGQPRGALAAIETARERLATTPEFAVWLGGMASLAHALLGEHEQATAGVQLVSTAATDTSSLLLAAVLPARMIVAARDANSAAVQSAVAEARALEAARDPDDEQAVIWRIFGVLGLQRVGDAAAARTLSKDLLELLDRTRVGMPVYRLLAELATAATRQDLDVVRRVRAELVQGGVHIAEGSCDPWGVLEVSCGSATADADEGSTGAAGSLRIDVLNGLRIFVDGAELDARRWSARRKPRIAIALLVASGGRIGRDQLVEDLWGSEQLSRNATGAKLSTVLSVARSVLGAGTVAPASGDDARALVLRETSVELALARADSSDVQQLRAIATSVRAADPRDYLALERAAQDLSQLVAGEPLRDLGTEPGLVRWQQSLRQEMLDATVSLQRAWLAATLSDHRDPSDALIALADEATRLDPVDEQAAGMQVDLLGRAGRTADASRAFHRVRMQLSDDLGLPPSIELVRRHAAAVSLHSESPEDATS